MTGVKQLSQVPPQEESATEGAELLTFRLGAEEYGIDILCVQEIRGYEPPTRIANAPEFMRGVCNLRGVIVPVVDLRMCFGVHQITGDASAVMVVLQLAGGPMGVVVDAVSDVIRLAQSDIRSAPSNATSEFIKGIATLGQGDAQKMLILLDIQGYIASMELRHKLAA